jgi:phosphoglycolate phosphatase-like HAD superfamily hydrolase
MMPKFVLFDIDGTLIGLDGASRRALDRAIYELTGSTDAFQSVNFSGKTDFQIIRQGLDWLGLESQTDLLNTVLNLYLVHLQGELATGKGQVKTGVNKLLSTLQAINDIYLGLLTGNTEKGARLKLSAFGLNRFFPLGAFGSDSEDRNLLLPVAVQRFRRTEVGPIDYQDCVVIGDTPRDVECARVHGATSIAVSTGSYTEARLKETEADLVLPDLSDTRKIVQWITAK